MRFHKGNFIGRLIASVDNVIKRAEKIVTILQVGYIKCIKRMRRATYEKEGHLNSVGRPDYKTARVNEEENIQMKTKEIK